ncbi:hypothetical protein T10_383 [Trichinella papuae]|uniref:Uncharacterized protein n=1 Tax=Trichinella papuae TaxID=268474 RepID=A0A0V1LYN0_9BILA|nr:hypothetical protein T10_383 [Trichinella papuae]
MTPGQTETAKVWDKGSYTMSQPIRKMQRQIDFRVQGQPRTKQG